jgi:hypothetical protein
MQSLELIGASAWCQPRGCEWRYSILGQKKSSRTTVSAALSPPALCMLSLARKAEVPAQFVRYLCAGTKHLAIQE